MENKLIPDNSFFYENYSSLKALVLAPHEDDEINVAGNLIQYLNTAKADVYVAFSTNGDYKNPAFTRIKEAIKSLSVLGVPENHVIFLGYGDSYNDYEGKHIFNTADDFIKSKAGFDETYGAWGYSDYAFIKNGEHSKYSKNNFIRDLKNVILDVHADLIVCVDYDQHPDHRMLTLAFDDTMYKILSDEENLYHPIVLKKFAYALAFSAYADLFSVNLKETKRPSVDTTGNYLSDIVGISYWIWEKRIRFPVTYQNRKNRLIIRNKLVRALLKHKSQLAVLHSESIINSDEVFWQRRTDSITYFAKVRAASGNAQHINDFHLINAEEVKDRNIVFAKYLWTPTDKEKEISFIWEKPQTVTLVRIYGNIENTSRILKLGIYLDDGYQKIIGPLPERGMPFDIYIGCHANILKCSIRILETIGTEYGIAECEIYSSLEQPSCIHPFIKLLINENFAYKYYIRKKNSTCGIGLYKWNVNSDITLEVIKGKSVLAGDKLQICNHDKVIVLKASAQQGKVYDLVMIERISDSKYIILKALQWFDRLWLTQYRIILYISRWYGYMKEEGVRQTLLRGFHKLEGRLR